MITLSIWSKYTYTQKSFCVNVYNITITLLLTYKCLKSCVHLFDSFLTPYSSGQNGSSIPSKGSLCGTKLGTWIRFNEIMQEEGVVCC